MNFIRQLGGSLGINAWVVFLEMRTHYHAETLAATQSSDNDASRELLSSVGQLLGEAGVSEAVQQSGALHYLEQVVHAQAATLGFQMVSGFSRSIPYWYMAGMDARPARQE